VNDFPHQVSHKEGMLAFVEREVHQVKVPLIAIDCH
jgi:hypothetical protein